MRTLIVSDLHLGSATRVDVLGQPGPRAALLDSLADVDRLVLLGDLLELRHGPRRRALQAAQPFFAALGEVFAGREIVVLAGNHDHALVEPWLAHRSEASAPGSLQAEQRFAAAEASPMLAAIAQWAAPARVSAAYPGLWVREDVYATHGHYLDCHMTIPTIERLGLGLIGRMQRRPVSLIAGAEDYEAVSSPIYAWIDAMAQSSRGHGPLNGQGTVRAWRALGGDPAHRPSSRRIAMRNRALVGAFPLAVAALNRAGLGPLRADVSGSALRRGALAAMGEVARRLGVEGQAAHVVFGHTHRTGPLPHDARSEWRTSGGAALYNCGCWTYDHYFLDGQAGESPYWPGGAVLVEDEGEPRLLRLLENRVPGELLPTSA